MKVNVTSLPALFLFSGKGLFLLMIALFLSAPAFSQGFTPEEEVGNLSEVKWKPTADLLPVFAAEQTKMSVALSPTTIAADEKALYMAYQRMLTYVQTDVQAGKPVDEAILESYKKVLVETETDPTLKSMPKGVLASYVPGLVEVLAQEIKPETSN